MSCQDERCCDTSLSTASLLGRAVVLGLNWAEKSTLFPMRGSVASSCPNAGAAAHHAQLRAEQLHLSGEAGEDAELVTNSAPVQNEGFIIPCTWTLMPLKGVHGEMWCSVGRHDAWLQRQPVVGGIRPLFVGIWWLHTCCKNLPATCVTGFAWLCVWDLVPPHSISRISIICVTCDPNAVAVVKCI